MKFLSVFRYSYVDNKFFIDKFSPQIIITARKQSLRRLCFYMCLAVHRGGLQAHTRGGGWGVWLGGVSRPTPGGRGIPACTEADPPKQTAIAAGGTHPTGMHSCEIKLSELPPFKSKFSWKLVVAEFHRTGVEEAYFGRVYKQHMSLCRFEGKENLEFT